MKDRALHAILLPLLLSPLATASPTADAQSIRRCNGADGTTIFTDRSCESFGARLASELTYDGGSANGDMRDAPVNLGDNGAMSTGFAIKGCARTQGELIYGVRGAIESGDVNRLSNYYHWTGVSQSAAVGLMDKLDRIARNTLSGVQFDYPMPSLDDYEYSTASYEAAPRAVIEPTPVAAMEVVYTAGPSYLDRYRPENDDVPILSTGIVDASTPLDEARMHASGGGGSFGYPENRANPRPVALRVNSGGGGTRFSLRQNAGCWFIQF